MRRKPKTPEQIAKACKTVKQVRKAIKAAENNQETYEEYAKVDVGNIGFSPSIDDLSEAEALVEDLKAAEYWSNLIDALMEREVELETR